MSTLSNLYASQAKYQQQIRDALERKFQVGELIGTVQGTYGYVSSVKDACRNCVQSLANGVAGSRSAITSASEINGNSERYSGDDNCLSSAVYYFKQEIQKLNNDIETAKNNLQSVEHKIQVEKERIRQEELARQRAERERRARQLAEAERKIISHLHHY